MVSKRGVLILRVNTVAVSLGITPDKALFQPTNVDT